MRERRQSSAAVDKAWPERGGDGPSQRSGPPHYRHSLSKGGGHAQVASLDQLLAHAEELFGKAVGAWARAPHQRPRYVWSSVQTSAHALAVLSDM